MCGIAGSVQAGGTVAPEVLDAQLKCLEHRGPDASGVFSGDGGAVGQNRLAIIDLVTGRPADHQRGRHGRRRAERRDLQLPRAARGAGSARATASPRTGDTEVIAHLAEDLDAVELARRLDGMFAFAVWDERRRRLVLGRDRVGKKPLYYWHGRRAGSCSAARSRRCSPIPRCRAGSTRGAIPAYLTFGYVPTPHTFFDGDPEPPARPRADVRRRGEPVRVERYWTPRVPGVDGTTRLDLSLSEAAREVRELADRRREAAPDLRRAARRVPQRRDRLQRGRRAHGAS